MDYYYITYLDRADQSGRYPTDIRLGYLDNDDIAEKYIIDGFSNNYQSVFWDVHSQDDRSYEVFIDTNSTPTLVTNNPRFYLLYKGVYSYTDFKHFCRVYDDYYSLNPMEKYKVDNGKGTREAFEYFEKLIAGNGKWAYQYLQGEQWHDDSGNSRWAEVESGWKIQNSYYVNEEIKKSILEKRTWH